MAFTKAPLALKIVPCGFCGHAPLVSEAEPNVCAAVCCGRYQHNVIVHGATLAGAIRRWNRTFRAVRAAHGRVVQK